MRVIWAKPWSLSLYAETSVHSAAKELDNTNIILKKVAPTHEIGLPLSNIFL